MVEDFGDVGDGRWRLYHLIDDPGETRDLSDAARQPFLHPIRVTRRIAIGPRLGQTPRRIDHLDQRLHGGHNLGLHHFGLHLDQDACRIDPLHRLQRCAGARDR